MIWINIRYFRYQGYANPVSFKLIEAEDIESVEKFVREDLSKQASAIKNSESKKWLFGQFTEKPNTFKFKAGEKRLINGLVEYVKRKPKPEYFQKGDISILRKKSTQGVLQIAPIGMVFGKKAKEEVTSEEINTNDLKRQLYDKSQTLIHKYRTHNIPKKRDFNPESVAITSIEGNTAHGTITCCFCDEDSKCGRPTGYCRDISTADWVVSNFGTHIKRKHITDDKQKGEKTVKNGKVNPKDKTKKNSTRTLKKQIASSEKPDNDDEQPKNSTGKEKNNVGAKKRSKNKISSSEGSESDNESNGELTKNDTNIETKLTSGKERSEEQIFLPEESEQEIVVKPTLADIIAEQIKVQLALVTKVLNEEDINKNGKNCSMRKLSDDQNLINVLCFQLKPLKPPYHLQKSILSLRRKIVAKIRSQYAAFAQDIVKRVNEPKRKMRKEVLEKECKRFMAEFADSEEILGGMETIRAVTKIHHVNILVIQPNASITVPCDFNRNNKRSLLVFCRGENRYETITYLSPELILAFANRIAQF